MPSRQATVPATLVVPRHPVHAALVPFPAVCFTLALATDVAYWRTADLMWKNFSAWLLFAGLVIGALAAIAGIVDTLVRRRRGLRAGWTHGVGSLLVLLAAFVNSLVHAGDGWTSVVPWGLVLSAVTVALIVVTAWMGRNVTYRQSVEATGHA